MSLIAAAGLTAFVLCLMATPLVRNFSSWAKLLDHPDTNRKLHRRAMPRLGGVAIALSYVAALILVMLVAPHQMLPSSRDSSLIHAALPATGIIFLTGLVDDLLTLKPWQKLLGQSLAAILAVSFGTQVSMPHGPVWLATGLSFFWLLLCANAFNLIDGIDGLAAGVALLAAVATLIPAILDGNLTLAILSVTLIGCLLAFLRYNFHPATIFLGDCGSLTVGFLLGCFVLNWRSHSGTAISAIAPAIALSLPLLDVALALGRRFIRSAPLFQGDRNHIHHKVLSRFMTTRRAVLILYAVCCVTSIFAVVLSYSQPQFEALILLIFFVFALIGIRSLRYVELIAVIRSFSRKSLLRLMKQEVYLLELESALDKASTAEAIWDIACMACEDLQFTSVRMQLQERCFEFRLTPDKELMAWEMTIPLGATGSLILTRVEKIEHSHLVFSVLDRLQNSVLKKALFAEDDPLPEPQFSYQGAA